MFRFDLQGHGESGGLTAYVDRFDDYVSDFSEVADRVSGYARDLPTFVIAHSMGALITATHILKHPEAFKGAIYTGGLFKVNEDISPFLQKISGVISAIMPKFKALKLDYGLLSRDPEVVKISAQDPLHYKGGMRARTGAELLKATKAIEGRLADWKLPVLILHGGNDQLTKPEASHNLFKHSTAEDKTLKIYDGAYHELLHEINRKDVMNDITDWLQERTP